VIRKMEIDIQGYVYGNSLHISQNMNELDDMWRVIFYDVIGSY